MRIRDWSSDVCSSDLSAFDTVALATASKALCMLLSSSTSQGTLALAPTLWASGRTRRPKDSGRASCRESVGQYVEVSVIAVTLNKNYLYRYIDTIDT